MPRGRGILNQNEFSKRVAPSSSHFLWLEVKEDDQESSVDATVDAPVDSEVAVDETPEVAPDLASLLHKRVSLPSFPSLLFLALSLISRVVYALTAQP
jgi:hypothetical protein